MIQDFGKINKVHFIGIGGIGISAVARMFILEGKKVSGSDMRESNVSESLRELGVKIEIGEDENNLPDDAQLVVYTIAISETNKEFEKAKRLNIETISYPETLSVISKNKKTIAITGTHGKTTTTSMIGKAMIDNHFDPTVIVGSILREWKSNFIGGKSEYFVVEGCEYRRSFLNLHPYILVITNIEADHLDYYKDLEDIKSAFRELAERVPEDGFIVTDLSNDSVRDVVAGLKCKILDYKKTDVGNLVLPKMPGEHNLNNARVAYTVLETLGAKMADIQKSLADFSGVWRRFEYKGEMKNGAVVYDDYAHHPTEIKAFMNGAREKFGDKKILAIFQPHMLSRTKDFLDGFAESLALADEVLLLPIYKAREEKEENISSEDLAEKIRAFGKRANVVLDHQMAEEMVLKLSSPDTVVATIGAGETNILAEKLITL